MNQYRVNIANEVLQGKRELISVGKETTYGTAVAPTYLLGRNAKFDPNKKLDKKGKTKNEELEKMIRTYFEAWEKVLSMLDTNTLKLFLNAMTCCETTRWKIDGLIRKQIDLDLSQKDKRGEL
jgi:hypothetical protein